jgi:hypothetical protein
MAWLADAARRPIRLASDLPGARTSTTARRTLDRGGDGD